MKQYKFVDLFAGIGGTRLAFEPYGECVYSCEIDDDARKTYEKNWDEKPTESDVKNIEDPTEEIPDHDILLACWPCPSFSRIGKKTGLEDERGSLFYEITDILETKKPDAFFLENVKDVRDMHGGDVLDIIEQELEDAGYTLHWEVLNALDFGLPQHRERLIMVGFKESVSEFEIPTETENALHTESKQRTELRERLEDDPDERYTASEKIRKDRRKSMGEIADDIETPSIWHENRAGLITAHPYSCALRANPSWNYLLIDGERLPTPRELLRLQGFPDKFKIPGNNYTRARRLTGNSIPVPIVEAVAERMMEKI